MDVPHHLSFDRNHFLDFHTHSQREADKNGVVEIVSIHLGQQKQHDLFTIGMHPWWTEAPISNNQREELRKRLKEENCLAMGEMGLDNLKGPSMDVQMDILRSQLEVADEIGLPVIIHCVRAFDQLIQIKKEFPSIKKWCIHGYGRHAILAKQLIDQGFYLSIMPTVDDKYRELFLSLPHDRLFLETDSMPDVSIIDIYSRVSAITGISLPELKQQISHNANKYFSR